MPAKRRILLGAALLVAVPVGAEAGIITIGPFVGSISESWESFPNYGNPGGPAHLADPSPVFGGSAEISNPLMAVYEPSSLWVFSLYTSGPAQVADGLRGMGMNDHSSTTRITFLTPVTMFGGYWGTVTGGAFPTPNSVALSFFDTLGAPIARDTFTYFRPGRDGVLEWHGWASTVPIASLEYSGDYVVNDALQAEPIPEPGTSVLLGLGLGALALRRRAGWG